MKIALNRSEEKIAQILVFQYSVDIKEEMIIRAVKTNMQDFLYCVFAYNKNFEFRKGYGRERQEEDDEDSDSGNESNEILENQEDMRKDPENYKVFTFDDLISKILKFCEEFAQ